MKEGIMLRMLSGSTESRRVILTMLKRTFLQLGADEIPTGHPMQSTQVDQSHLPSTITHPTWAYSLIEHMQKGEAWPWMTMPIPTTSAQLPDRQDDSTRNITQTPLMEAYQNLYKQQENLPHTTRDLLNFQHTRDILYIEELFPCQPLNIET
jgi:hypothetical protein